MGSQGEGLGDKSTPVGVGLLNGEGWGPGDVSVKEGGSEGVGGHGLSQAQNHKGDEASLK